MDNSLTLIRARRAEIAKLRRDLDAEEADLAQAERTIVRLSAKVAQAGNGAQKSPMTHREYVIAALRQSESDWFDTGEALRQEVIRIFNKDIKPTSFQPLVSGMTTEDGAELRRNERGQIGLIERVGTG